MGCEFSIASVLSPPVGANVLNLRTAKDTKLPEGSDSQVFLPEIQGEIRTIPVG